MSNLVVLDRKKFNVDGFSDVMSATEKLFKGEQDSVARSMMLLLLGQACNTYLQSLPISKNGVKKNYFRIFGDLFYCQTENGFNNAIYEITDPGKVENKKFYRRMVTSWPKKYPALVSFCDNSFEEGRIYVQWVPVTNLLGSSLPKSKRAMSTQSDAKND